MLMVANKKGEDVFLSDLGIKIKRKQVVDLHRLNLLISPEKSKSLRDALSCGDVFLLNKARKKEETQQQIDNSSNIKLLSDIKTIVKNEIAKTKRAPDNDDVLKAIANLVSVVGKKEKREKEDIKDETENVKDGPDEDKLVEIHSKSLGRISLKNIDKKLSYKEQNISDKSVSDNASE
jgi:hypothetical protein